MRIMGLPIFACFEAEGITSKGSKQSVQIQNVEMKMGKIFWGNRKNGNYQAGPYNSVYVQLATIEL